GRFPHRFVVTSSADGEAAPTAVTKAAPALGSSEPSWTREPAPLPATGIDYGTGAWAGVNILEFGSGAAGPISTRYFAEHGATVLRIESASPPPPPPLIAPRPNNPPPPPPSPLHA